VAKNLGILAGSEVLGPDYFDNVALRSKADVLAEIKAAAGFSEVMPEQKHFVVSALQAQEVVGMTGDGVNDAAALKQSDVGIAVHGASDAARGASDLVFSRPGIGPIVVCIVRARKIFERLRNYLLFRISISISILSCSFILLLAHSFSLPPLALVVLVICLDLTVLASSKDKVGCALQLSIVLSNILWQRCFLLRSRVSGGWERWWCWRWC
jgi:H+-transporting ATPase